VRGSKVQYNNNLQNHPPASVQALTRDPVIRDVFNIDVTTSALSCSKADRKKDHGLGKSAVRAFAEGHCWSTTGVPDSKEE
jgi:hypothetical protein